MYNIIMPRGYGRMVSNLTEEQWEYVRRRYIDDAVIFVAKVHSLLEMDIPDESKMKALNLLMKEYEYNSMR